MIAVVQLLGEVSGNDAEENASATQDVPPQTIALQSEQYTGGRLDAALFRARAGIGVNGCSPDEVLSGLGNREGDHEDDDEDVQGQRQAADRRHQRICTGSDDMGFNVHTFSDGTRIRRVNCSCTRATSEHV